MARPKIIVTGITHSATSLVARLVDELVVDANLPTDPYDHPELDWKTHEATEVNEINHYFSGQYENTIEQNEDVYPKALKAWKHSFPNQGYIWKSTHIYNYFYFWWKFWQAHNLTPDMAVICLRDPLAHGLSVSRRYDRHPDQVAKELQDAYPLLVRVATWIPTTVVFVDRVNTFRDGNVLKLKDFMKDVKPDIKLNKKPNYNFIMKDKLTTAPYEYKTLVDLRDDLNYHTLLGLAKRYQREDVEDGLQRL